MSEPVEYEESYAILNVGIGVPAGVTFERFRRFPMLYAFLTRLLTRTRAP
jgi:hypothetical protein